VQLGAMLSPEANVGQHVGLGLVHQRGELRDAQPRLRAARPPIASNDKY
jgi:hypothetical protein